MNVLNAADQRMTLPEVRRLTGDVLDSIDITDVVYHEFMFARPLVEDILFRVVNLAEPGGKVMVAGGNSLLCHAILAAGYDLHLWKFGENLMSGELDKYRRGAVSQEEFKTGQLPFDDRYDAIVLPLVFEHLPEYPLPALKALRRFLRRDGVIVAATRNLAVLGTRIRALRGQPILPEYRASDVFFSVNWPDLQAHRYYLRSELVTMAEAAGYALVEAEYVVGRTVYEADPLFGVGGWLSRIAKHQLKRAMPSLRDYILVTLRHPTAEEVRRGAVRSITLDDLPQDPLPALPTVTVVLPTHNRSDMLQDAFSGLLQQTYPFDRFDVVLINDASTDDTDAVASRLALQAPFKVHYIRTPGLGAVGARNFGMREATGEIVAHLDDDNRPVPEWIEEAVRGFRSPDVAIVGGPVTPKPEQPLGMLCFYPNYAEDRGIYPTSNVFYRREVALEVGGFDESFGGSLLGRPLTGWDSDLAWRIRRRGYRARFRPGVIAYQEVLRQEPMEWVKDAWRLTSLPETVKRVPELGDHLLDTGVFVPSLSKRFDLAVVGVGLALAKRHPLPLMLTLPWLDLCGRLFAGDRWPPTRWPKFAARFLLLWARQSVGLAALMRGSVRSRRVVL